MKTFHIKFETDKEAMQYATELTNNHVPCHVSFGFGSSPAIVVAYTDNADVLGDAEYELIGYDTSLEVEDEEEVEDDDDAL